jgi:tRNA(fMet)-specific endonuclease VapC
MTVAELFYGAKKSNNKGKNTNLIAEFLLTVTVEIIHSDLEILKKYGNLKAFPGKAGIILSDADFFIAATALVRCNMLITRNIKHFKKIEALRIENWIR